MTWGIAIVVVLLILAAARARQGWNAYIETVLGVVGVAIMALAIPDDQQTWLRVSYVVMGAATTVTAGVLLLRRTRVRPS